MAERLKCKPSIARSEPVRQAEPQGSTDSETDSEMDDDDDDAINQPPADFSNLDLEPLDVVAAPRRRRLVEPPARSLDVEPEPPRRRDSYKPLRSQQQRPIEPPVDLDALRDKYRPKVAEKEPDLSSDSDNDTKASPDYDDEPTGTIILEPIRPPTPPVEKIEVKPIQQTYVEMKKPLKGKLCLQKKKRGLLP